MYNVRLIKYPTGYQVRLYSEPFGVENEVQDDVADLRYLMCGERKVGKDLVDGFTGEIIAGDFFVESEFETGEWYDVDVDFKDVQDFMKAQAEAELEKKRAHSIQVSVARTKNNLYYLARSNIWDWFVTLTIAPDKMDRYDFVECSKKVRKWFDNLRQRKCKDMFYLIVPEMHKDGAWHFHGLLGCCSQLSMADSGKVTESGDKIYNLDDWRYGFSTATAVVDSQCVSNYVCKYITKEFCATTKGRHRYWASSNVGRAEVLEGYMNAVQLKMFRERLMDNMTWKGKHQTEFVDVEYFELPADDNILE